MRARQDLHRARADVGTDIKQRVRLAARRRERRRLLPRRHDGVAVAPPPRLEELRVGVRARVRVRVLGLRLGLELTPRLEELARQVVLRRVAECDAAVGPEKDALAHLLA